MIANDCGEIPVVESKKTMKPIGVINRSRHYLSDGGSREESARDDSERVHVESERHRRSRCQSGGTLAK